MKKTTRPKKESRTVSYLKKNKNFLMYYGNKFRFEMLPKKTRIIEPNPPLTPLKNPRAIINQALENPLKSKPLSQLLKPGMKVTIAFDDISIPLPAMKQPDPRQIAIELILQKCKKAGITDIHMIAALCLHRRMTKKELTHMLGKKLISKYYPHQLYNHDAEDRDNMTYIGKTKNGFGVHVSKRAADSDIVIYVNINFVQMDGGHKSLATGLCDYHTVSHNHNHDTLMKSKSYFDPSKSKLHDILNEQGRLIEKKLNVFHLEMTINNDLFSPPLRTLQKPYKNQSLFDHAVQHTLAISSKILPEVVMRTISQSVRANYGLLGAYAGDVEKVHEKSLQDNFKQYEVTVNGQSDIVIAGIPDISPYSVNSILNPILFVCLCHGYFFNLYRNKPIVKKGGVLIATHPLFEDFNMTHHPSYKEFYDRVLTQTTNTREIEKRFEKEFAQNKKYIHLYRKSHAYHGVHPFYMWYWGCYGLSYVGKTIIVGAQSKRACKILGFDHAPNMKQALAKAKSFLKNKNATTSFVKVPPVLTMHVK